jgi:hypothetical protein
MPTPIRTKDAPNIIKRIAQKVKKQSLSFNKIVPYQTSAVPAPNKIKTKATSKKNTKISIFSPLKHFNHIKQIQSEHRQIKQYQIQSSCFPTDSSCNSCANEKQNVHIKSEHYSNSAQSVDDCDHIVYIKLIPAVKFKILNKSFHKITSLSLSDIIISQNLLFVNTF